MANEMKSVMIGLFVIAACVLIIFILMFLHPSVGDNAKTLKVRFPDIDKVNIGTRVTFAGKPVGEVIEINEVEDARKTRIGYKGDVYIYELVLKVDSGVRVYNTDDISVRTSGLLGEKNIAIDPQAAIPGEKIYRVDDQVLYATQVGSVEGTLKDFSALTKKIEKALDGVIDMFDNIKKEKLVSYVGETAKNLSEITGALNKPEQWASTLTNVSKLSDRVNTSWDTVDKSIHEFHSSSVNLRDLTGQGKDLVASIGEGKGTLGHLIAGDDLYLRLASVLSKGETVMDDVNQYGFLFHLNKRWQRIQAKRLDLMNRLSTPSEFSRYFNAELNQISSSLGRVSLILNETDYQCYPQSLLCNPEFTHKFSELMKKFDKMQEELKFYNQQIVDEDNCCQY